MTVRDYGPEALAEALLEQGFRTSDEFGLCITYQRADDPLKIHVGPDGSFTAVDSCDDVVAEGKGTEDLYAVLVTKTHLFAVTPGRLGQRRPRKAK